ncbi:MULTI-COPPER OXIDASE [Salix purpurea]|uniref:MULTI-COPPER OXIDASE n=1 Tax=Salix purpurea TaxID=77065 RepID=A0A9Q0WBJ3_SALPP|nr:MULTI-COPPER OXIDASE [Salix purpurea]
MDGAGGCTKSPLWFGLNCFKLPSATVDSYNLSAAQNISFNEEKNGSFQAHLSEAETHYHEFVIQAKPVKRLCRTHNSITVNGLFPGPTLEVRDGDSLVIKAVNNARYNVTLHW